VTVGDDWLTALRGQLVVADLDESYLVIGVLVEADEACLIFTDADLHDHREANCTKDVYLIETLKLGVRANRKRVVVPRRRMVAISRLEDIAS
jgi:hypothetical protein